MFATVVALFSGSVTNYIYLITLSGLRVGRDFFFAHSVRTDSYQIVPGIMRTRRETSSFASGVKVKNA